MRCFAVSHKRLLNCSDASRGNRVNHSLLHKGGTITYYTTDGKISFKSIPEDSFDMKGQGLKNGEIKSFFSQISKSVNEYIVRNNFIIPEIERENIGVRRKNNKACSELEIDEEFYEIDLNGSYWCILHQMDITSYNLFQTYMGFDKHKDLRNISIGKIASIAYKDFYIYKGKQEIVYRIEEDKSLHKQVYQNIVNTSANYIYHALQAIGNDFLWYTIDSICVTKKSLEAAKKSLQSSGLSIKIGLLQKIDEKHYMKPGGFVKKF